MERYAVVARQSRLLVKVFASGMLAGFGHNPKIAMRALDGSVSFAPDAPEKTEVTLHVRPEALEVTGDVKASDRRDIERNTRDEVLEVGKFPDALFESSSTTASGAGGNAFDLEVRGRLTLHGQTESTVIPAHVSLLGETLRVRGAFPVRQSAFGIRPPSIAGGALKVKDEVELEFEIVAQRQQAAPTESGGLGS